MPFRSSEPDGAEARRSCRLGQKRCCQRRCRPAEAPGGVPAGQERRGASAAENPAEAPGGASAGRDRRQAEPPEPNRPSRSSAQVSAGWFRPATPFLFLRFPEFAVMPPWGGPPDKAPDRPASGLPDMLVIVPRATDYCRSGMGTGSHSLHNAWPDQRLAKPAPGHHNLTGIHTYMPHQWYAEMLSSDTIHKLYDVSRPTRLLLRITSVHTRPRQTTPEPSKAHLNQKHLQTEGVAPEDESPNALGPAEQCKSGEHPRWVCVREQCGGPAQQMQLKNAGPFHEPPKTACGDPVSDPVKCTVAIAMRLTEGSLEHYSAEAVEPDRDVLEEVRLALLQSRLYGSGWRGRRLAGNRRRLEGDRRRVEGNRRRVEGNRRRLEGD